MNDLDKLESQASVDMIVDEYKNALEVDGHPLESDMCCTESR